MGAIRTAQSESGHLDVEPDMPTTFRTPARIALVLIASILAVAGCSSGDAIGTSGSAPTTVAKPGSSAKSVVVHIRNYTFVPPKTTVAAGSSITFVNDDKVAHTGTDPKGALTRAPSAPGKSKTVKVKATAVGTVPYVCSIHQFMTGTVTVTG